MRRPPRHEPCHRAIMAVDVEASTTRRNPDKITLRAALSRSRTPLSLVVSDSIYQSIIRHGYDSIEEQSFQPLVHVTIAGRQHHGWVH